MSENGNPRRQLAADLRKVVGELEESEVRYLVDTYYQVQEYRKRAANQGRAAGEAEEPAAAILLVLDQFEGMENAIRSALDRWTDEHPMGRWAKAHLGVGPVISAGLIAHIDPERATTAGAVWRFAGLDPTLEWGKGEKRPYNARLKVLAWKLSESFKKLSGREDCFYGQLYRQRKALEIERNDAGANKELAAKALAEHPKHKQKAIYEQGKLPDGRLDLRAERWVVKLFLAHFWEAWRLERGLPVPSPYPIAHLGHTHTIEAP